MKCNKQLKYSNHVAFGHFHGTAVNNSGLVYSRKAKVVEVKYRTEKIKDRNSLEMRIAKLRNTYDGIIINSYNTEEGYKVYIDFAIIDSLYKEFIEELKKIVNYYAQGCEIVEGIVQF